MNVTRQRWLTVALVLACGVSSPAADPPGDSPRGDDEASKVDEWAAALTSVEMDERRDAAYSLARIGQDALPAIDALIKGLGDRDDQVWMQSAMAVARIGPEAEPAIEALVQSLGDDDQQRRYRSGWVLSKIGSAAVPALVDAAKDDSTRRRIAALDAMGWMDGDADRLLEHLNDAVRDDDPDVRRQAAASLSRLGPAAADSLGAALGSEDAAVRGIAAEGLAKTKQHAAPYRERLIELLHDPDSAVRAAAVVAVSVASQPDDQLIEWIIDAVVDRDVQVRSGGVIALRNLGDAADRAVDRLIEFLQSDDSQHRDAAAFALGTLGPRGAKAIGPLIASLKQDNESKDDSDTGADQPSPIDDALRRIGAASVPALLDAASDADHSRSRLAKALAQIGPVATEPLIKALRTETGGSKTIAAQAIGKMRTVPASAVGPLAACLDDADPRLRASAAAALGRYPQLDDHVVSQLRTLCQDQQPEVRAAAVSAVANVDDAPSRVTKQMLEALDDDAAEVRRNAIGGLARMETASGDVIDALILGLDDSDARVRREAALAIEAVGEAARRSAPRLMQLVGDEDSSVRSAAASALATTAAPSEDLIVVLGDGLADAEDAVVLASLRSVTTLAGRAVSLSDQVITLTDHDRADLRAAAYACLAKIETDRQKSVPLLIQGLADPDWAVRRDAGESLGELGADAKSAVPALFRLLPVPEDTNFAKTALRAINTAGPEAVPVLLAGIESNDRRQQYYSLYMLGKVRPRATEAIPILERLLKETDSRGMKRAYEKAIDEIRGRD
ncbi:HEAT repeat domain-containing protein [Rhodopirellula sp. JC639]|uniref:HEAT repeat domain-containing protein n=1 Tax=Stieleria mannarensis TaxID=2755585 RepID=UPI0015FEBC53|nr:HEAT repeat domain-containing protein [Rhodopirellula sp. JC639]